MPSISSSSCTVPSSPSRPCSAMNAASGARSRSSATSSAPTSIASTSWPSRCSASSTLRAGAQRHAALQRAPALEHRDLARSPSGSACRCVGPGGAPWRSPARLQRCSSRLPCRRDRRRGRSVRPASADVAGRAAPCLVRPAQQRRRRRPGRRVPVSVPNRPTCSRTTLPMRRIPSRMSSLGHAREVQAHRGARRAPVQVGGAPGHERDALALQRPRQQVGGVDVAGSVAQMNSPPCGSVQLASRRSARPAPRASRRGAAR